MACPRSAYWPAAVACRPASAGAGLAPAGLPCTWAAPCPCLGLRGLLAPLVGSSCCREFWAGSGSSQPGPLPRLARWSEGRSAVGGGSRTPPPAAVADGRRRRRLSAPPRALAAAASHAQPSVPRAAARAASPRVLLRPRKSTAHKQKNKGKSKNKTENSSPNYSLNTQRIRSRFQP